MSRRRPALVSGHPLFAKSSVGFGVCLSEFEMFSTSDPILVSC